MSPVCDPCTSPRCVGYPGVEPSSVLLPRQAAHPEPCTRCCKSRMSGPTCAGGPLPAGAISPVALRRRRRARTSAGPVYQTVPGTCSPFLPRRRTGGNSSGVARLRPGTSCPPREPSSLGCLAASPRRAQVPMYTAGRGSCNCESLCRYPTCPYDSDIWNSTSAR